MRIIFLTILLSLTACGTDEPNEPEAPICIPLEDGTWTAVDKHGHQYTFENCDQVLSLIERD